MKKLLPILLFFVVLCSFSQTPKNPVVWKTSVEKITDSTFQLIFKGKILENWYVFSQYNPENASLPLVISIPEGETGFELIGKAKESKTIKKYSDVWEKEEIIFKETATLVQEIKLTNKRITQVKLNLFGQVCETACIQFDDIYSFSLNGTSIKKEEVTLDEKSKKLTELLTLKLQNTALLNIDKKAEKDSDYSTGWGDYTVMEKPSWL